MKRTILDYTLKIRLPLTLFVVALSFIITFYISRPERDNIGYSPEQPIKFSHKLHAGQMAIDCQYCHLGVSKGRHATIPSVNICMNCHSIARKDKPEIIKLTHFYEAGIPIPWKRVHKIPEYSYFNHSVHINKGIECETCHGDIKQMTTAKQVKPFTMGDCLECHRNPRSQISYLKTINKGPENCWACHR
jgi:predicted CXXCH cytochrome family protein